MDFNVIANSQNTSRRSGTKLSNIAPSTNATLGPVGLLGKVANQLIACLTCLISAHICHGTKCLSTNGSHPADGIVLQVCAIMPEHLSAGVFGIPGDEPADRVVVG